MVHDLLVNDKVVFGRVPGMISLRHRTGGRDLLFSPMIWQVAYLTGNNGNLHFLTPRDTFLEGANNGAYCDNEAYTNGQHVWIDLDCVFDSREAIEELTMGEFLSEAVQACCYSLTLY